MTETVTLLLSSRLAKKLDALKTDNSVSYEEIIEFLVDERQHETLTLKQKKALDRTLELHKDGLKLLAE